MRTFFFVASLFAASSVYSATVVVDFEDEDLVDSAVIQTQGYEFVSENTLTGFGGLLSGNFLAYCPDCTVTMSKVEGQAFSLSSFDVSNIGFPVTGDTSFTVTGFFAGGGEISELVDLPLVAPITDYTNVVFSPAWSNLDRVEFGSAPILTAIALDNIIVTAVPVPAAAWLFGSALMGLGWWRRQPQSRSV